MENGIRMRPMLIVEEVNVVQNVRSFLVVKQIPIVMRMEFAIWIPNDALLQHVSMKNWINMKQELIVVVEKNLGVYHAKKLA
jgi:hypothetical protein